MKVKEIETAFIKYWKSEIDQTEFDHIIQKSKLNGDALTIIQCNIAIRFLKGRC